MCKHFIHVFHGVDLVNKVLVFISLFLRRYILCNVLYSVLTELGLSEINSADFFKRNKKVYQTVITWFLSCIFKMSDDSRTLWCGNLSDKVTEELLYELFLQAGPLETVRIPKSRDGKQRNFGFITFKHECSVMYALSLFEGTRLYSRGLLLKARHCTSNDIPQKGQGTIASERQRTQSLPLNFGLSVNSPPAVDYDVLLQLGQQMFIPGSLSSMSGQLNQFGSFPQSSGSNLYASQMNSAYYLGGQLTSNTNNEKVSKSNHDNHGHNRNHPYSRGAGNRDYDYNHSNNGRHSSSNSPQYHHDTGRRGNYGRRY
ncbi:hypothetical protein C0J52_27904 [Blattella germanica]|nr:hypothetical protein C0J52_27904 [Blattella germanica]